MNDLPVRNWIPYKLDKTGAEILCHWLNAYDIPFTEPFFDETLSKLVNKRRSYTPTRSVSSIAMINEWAAGLEDAQPAAIIFHISRCGSTLATQLLATSPQYTVLSEVPFFDTILRLPFQSADYTQEQSLQLFISALKFYGQKRTGPETSTFIKADSWHIFFYEQLRRLYPTVPFILMYRNPVEVFNSHQKQPGMHAVPGLIEPAVMGFAPDEETLFLPGRYLAVVLEKYLRKYLDILETDANTLLINYNEGYMPIIKRITAFSGLSLSSEQLKKMEERSRYHSKRPGEIFSEKQPDQIPDFLAETMELYKQLQARHVYSSN